MDESGNSIIYRQPSIILKIGTSKEPGVVIGAHFDTVKKYTPVDSKQICSIYQDAARRKSCEIFFSSDKPGADDNGSGSAIVLQIARIFLNSNMKFKKPIYLIWYAAEEEGLVCSQAVVKDFQERKIPIAAVMQLDQTGYAYQNDPTMWLVTNGVDADLTNYLAKLITTYIHQPIQYAACSHTCSDNWSWQHQGIPVAFPFESEMSWEKHYFYAHSPQDTIDKLSIPHMMDYAKLALAFAVELAETIPGTSKPLARN